jgi:glutaredoxin
MGGNVPVKLYTLSTCSHCKAAKRFFSDQGIEFDFTDVDLLEGEERSAAIADVRKINPQLSFPTILIGDQVIVGTRIDKIKSALEIE